MFGKCGVNVLEGKKGPPRDHPRRVAPHLSGSSFACHGFFLPALADAAKLYPRFQNPIAACEIHAPETY